ncbi:hypothetical protein HHI36_007489 [Cryptolaemus montrouzieri]|uniref:Uncharacterized protein n=1 Tax=Cryptolaemus montrouzieri TaxID=559131 RepID=A0ABD2MPX3_9CUCU
MMTKAKCKKLKERKASVKEGFFREFLNQGSIHGFNHLGDTKKHIIEKIIWFSLIICAVYGAGNLSLLTLRRYYDNPTVISMERDRFAWNTSFPAATICPELKYDEESLEKYVEDSDAANKTLFRDFIVSLMEANYQNLENVVDYSNGIPSEKYLDLILQLKMKFHPSEISNSAGNLRVNYLTEIISEMGICYSYNSQLAVYSSHEYWKKGQWKLVQENETLNVNPLDGEVFANVMNISSGFDKMQTRTSKLTQTLQTVEGRFALDWDINPSSLLLHRVEGVAPVPFRFPCSSSCEVDCQLSRHRFGGRPTGLLPCERLILLERECICLPNCDEVVYYVNDLDTREWFLGSNLQWGLKDYPKMRLRRDVIFGFTELLVYIGGMAGLFLGCSVLSFIEILYFFTMRLFGSL